MGERVLLQEVEIFLERFKDLLKICQLEKNSQYSRHKHYKHPRIGAPDR
jgi:hypothetical protein